MEGSQTDLKKAAPAAPLLGDSDPVASSGTRRPLIKARYAASLSPRPLPENMPPVPKARMEDPVWWRLGCVPFIVLVMAAAAADFSFPRESEFGVGSGMGCALFLGALLLLRKDFSFGERLFITGFAIVNFLALACSGNMLNCWASFMLPLLMMLVPARQPNAVPGTRYYSWWGFWVSKRPKERGRGVFASLRGCLPMLICILAGAICFVLFLTIFASGNPVVEKVWEAIVEWWNDLVRYFDISWDFAIHVFYWIVGVTVFGVYAIRRPVAAEAPSKPEEKEDGARSILPYLPLCILLGINLAFGIATSTDVAYLWFKNVPEGVSQTAYLHDGAASISWASVLAVVVLAFFFRRRGSVRYSFVPKLLGYVLVLQTFLLAVSVYMRLYYQIGDYGFTVMRVRAAEAMLLGVAGLAVLVCYMASNGNFWKSARICLGVMLLMIFAFCICSPSRVAGTLNLRYLGSHPHWKFVASDFGAGRFEIKENLAFAEYVSNSLSQKDSDAYHEFQESGFAERIRNAALDVELRANSDSWLTWTFALQQDIPAAERILNRPIVFHAVAKEVAQEVQAADQAGVPSPAAVASPEKEPVSEKESLEINFSESGGIPPAPSDSVSSQLETPAPEPSF